MRHCAAARGAAVGPDAVQWAGGDRRVILLLYASGYMPRGTWYMRVYVTRRQWMQDGAQRRDTAAPAGIGSRMLRMVWVKHGLMRRGPWSYMQDVLMDWSKENEYCDVKKG